MSERTESNQQPVDSLVRLLRLVLNDAQTGNVRGLVALVFVGGGVRMVRAGELKHDQVVNGLEVAKMSFVMEQIEQAGPPPEPEPEQRRIVVPGMMPPGMRR